MRDLAALWADVAEALDRIEARYVVVGSVAAAAWGSLRSTRDIDIAAAIDAERIDQLLDDLVSRDLYVPIDHARRAIETSGSFNVIRPTTGAKIDLFPIAADDEFEAVRLERRVRSRVLGFDTWIATAEDVVLAKLRWRLESRSDTQWRDCIDIATASRLDEDHLRAWAPRLEVGDDLDALLAAVEATR